MMGEKKTEIQLNKDVRTNNNTEQMIAHVYLLFFCMQAYRIHTQQWNVAIQIIIAGTCVHIALKPRKKWGFVSFCGFAYCVWVSGLESNHDGILQIK